MTVRVARHGAVTTITIDRPQARNAVDRETAAALYAAFEAFAADDGASAAVLTGAGGCFCAGADLKAIADGRPNRVAPGGPGPMGPTRMFIDKPVVAAIEGHAVAGGLELALWCDLRVVSATAIFGVFCRRWGVPLIDGGTVRLPRIVGLGRALDLILTGRAVGAEEALRIGLVDRVVSAGDSRLAAEALAREIAVHPQACMRADRRSVYGSLDRSLLDGLDREFEGGLNAVAEEGLAGAAAFAGGAGRHGQSRE